MTSSTYFCTLFSLLVSVFFSTASTDGITFIILGQRSIFDEEKTHSLKKSILQQAESLEKNVAVLVPPQDFPEVVGHWAPWTLVSRIASLTTSDWYVFVECDSVVNASVLFDFLKDFVPGRKIFLGRGLRDESPTIIHHFYGFDHEADDDFLFPDFASGFVLSKELLTKLALALDTSTSKVGSSFAIDAKHELALMISKLCKAKLSSFPDRFCIRKNEGCAIFYEETPCAKETSLTTEDLFIGVKTYSGFHNVRLPVIKRTWAASDLSIAFFSDIANYVIPTIATGVANTERGHCAKTLVILKHFVNLLDGHDSSQKFSWLLIADDDTLISIARLLRILSCYDSNEKVIIGERYGFGFSSSGTTGYDYPTGGAGMVFSSTAARTIVSDCECPSDDSPDDMIIGMCSRRLGINIIHNAAFHQARPVDYPAPYLKRLSPISFHKFDDIDPYEVYMEYLFEPSDRRRKTEL